jgi:hypothetical protein
MYKPDGEVSWMGNQQGGICPRRQFEQDEVRYSAGALIVQCPERLMWAVCIM